MPKLVSSRAGQISVPGPGRHYTSPAKKRNPRKTQKISMPIGHSIRQQLLYDKMNALKAKKPAPPDPEDAYEPLMEDADGGLDHDVGSSPIKSQTTGSSPITKNKDTPTTDTNQRRHEGWSDIVAGLLPELLHFEKLSIGHVPPPPAGDLQSDCLQPGQCIPKKHKICCLHFDRTWHRMSFPLNNSMLILVGQTSDSLRS